MQGNIVYIELGLVHEDETLHFYRELFQWQISRSYLSPQTYYMFETPDQKMTGGFDASITPNHLGPRIYLNVLDMNDIIHHIKLNHIKATILKEKTLISKAYGYYALISDPSHNLIGLQSKT